MTGKYAVEEVQDQNNSHPKNYLERNVLFLDDFFVEAAARWGVEVFGFVNQGLCSPEVLEVGCALAGGRGARSLRCSVLARFANSAEDELHYCLAKFTCRARLVNVR